MQPSPPNDSTDSTSFSIHLRHGCVIAGKIACVVVVSAGVLAVANVLSGIALPMLCSESAFHGVVLMGAASGLGLGSLLMPFLCKSAMYRYTEHNIKDVVKYLKHGMQICATTTAIVGIVLPIIAPLTCLAVPSGLAFCKIYHII